MTSDDSFDISKVGAKEVTSKVSVAPSLPQAQATIVSKNISSLKLEKRKTSETGNHAVVIVYNLSPKVSHRVLIMV